MEIKDLTKAEEQIMQIVWQLESGFVKEVMDYLTCYRKTVRWLFRKLGREHVFVLCKGREIRFR